MWNIIELRKDNDLTQYQISLYLNINRRSYGNIEKGKRKLNIEECIKLALLYDVSIEYIYGLTDDKSIRLHVDKYKRNDIIRSYNIDINYYNKLRNIIIEHEKRLEFSREITKSKIT